MKQRTVKARITLQLAVFSLVLVAGASLLAHTLINWGFARYATRRQQEKTQELVSSLAERFEEETMAWNRDYIHMLGMYALYDGYIIGVYDLEGKEVWGAQTHDMSMCYQVMGDVQRRMDGRLPGKNNGFSMETYPLAREGRQVGTVELSYYGPYSLSENDFDFLRTMNIALAAAALLAVAASFLAGSRIAAHISRPVLQAARAAEALAAGSYAPGLAEEAGTLELNALACSFNRLAASLQRQERLRKQLTADVAHELRTPLTSIGTHLEAMIDGLWQPTAERLQSCYEEIERLSRLVKDLEGLARAEHEQPQAAAEWVDCRTLAERCLDQLSLEIAQKQLCIQVRGDKAGLYGEPDRLYQVLYNLVANGVKYTPQEGRIIITLEEQGSTVAFTVEDSGIGIDPEDLPYIFERFYRADKSRSRSTGGAGIGLAVVKSIVGGYGGRVSAESTPGQGSIFRVVLPKRE